MRVAVLGLLVSMVLATVVAGICLRGREVLAQYPVGNRPAHGVAEGKLIALTAPAGEGRQQVTLIDPALRVMSVYHIDLATGKISLKSVRNIRWDLEMDDFNGTNPSPREIRSMLEPR